MKLLITGGSGTLGQKITKLALSKNYQVNILTRNKKLKGVKLGPYANVSAARQSIDVTRTMFGIRNCSDVVFRNRSRLCIKHQVGK